MCNTLEVFQFCVVPDLMPLEEIRGFEKLSSADRISFEQFLPIYEDICKKKDQSTEDDFIEGFDEKHIFRLD